jgi:hypothetical protein
VDWIHLAHDKDEWQALMNMVMNLIQDGKGFCSIRLLVC